MRKYKGTVLTIQVFCVLLLIMSGLLERSVTQIAYCFTAFSSPFLIIAFGEAAFYFERVDFPAAGVVVFEGIISALFIGTMVTGMKMDATTQQGCGTFLSVYCLAVAASVIERVITTARVKHVQEE